MAATLYLTAQEQKVFAALSKDLQEGWKLEEETGTSYESVRQIAMRYHMADFSAYPKLQRVIDMIMSGKNLSGFSFDDLPPESFKELSFTMGARGINSLMQTLITDIKNDDDMQALASLSAMRHELLAINSSATHA